LNPRPKLRFVYFYVRSFTKVLLGPGHSMKQPNRRAQPECKSRVALRRNHSARSLNDARFRYEIRNGLTDFGLVRYLGSEGKVSALSIGTYVLQRTFTS